MSSDKPRRPRVWRPRGWEPDPEVEARTPMFREEAIRAANAAWKIQEAKRVRSKAVIDIASMAAAALMVEIPRQRRPMTAAKPDPRLMTEAQLAAMAHALMVAQRYDWAWNARPDQRMPASFLIWLILAGRGWGKTRCAGEAAREVAMAKPGARIAVIAKDHRALRDVCFEGISGLRNIIPNELQAVWKKGLGDVSLELTNGSIFIGYTSAEPDAIRGQAFDLIWGDEFAAWPKNRAQDMLDQALMCLRESEDARCILTTTPKRIKHVLDMVKLAEDPVEEIVITRGKTTDNTKLGVKAVQALLRKYAGTRVGRQELEGELLMDVEGVLWTQAMVLSAQWIDEEDERGNVIEHPPIVGTLTGVDPSGSALGDATGVVTVGWDAHKTIYVIENRSCQGTPGERFTAACLSAFENDSMEIWVESAFSGDQARFGIAQQWKNLQESGAIPMEHPCPPVKASTLKGDKAERAMPVVALYEQQLVFATLPDRRPRIWHLGDDEGLERRLVALEDEQLTWSPRESAGTKKKSPNIIDAEVHAVRQVMRRLGLETMIGKPGRERRWDANVYNPFS